MIHIQNRYLRFSCFANFKFKFYKTRIPNVSSKSRLFTMDTVDCPGSLWVLGLYSLGFKVVTFWKMNTELFFEWIYLDALFFLEDMSVFCGETDTPVLDFWWRLLWVSKPDILRDSPLVRHLPISWTWISCLQQFKNCGGKYDFSTTFHPHFGIQSNFAQVNCDCD